MATLLPDLSDTHREIQRLAREFAQGEIAPHAAEWNAAHHVPGRCAAPAMGELGFLGVIIPEEDGGAGLDYTCLTLVIEEIAAADAGTSVGVAVQNSLGAAPDRALRHPGAAPKEAHLPALASGERFAAYALTEPGARLRRRPPAHGGAAARRRRLAR